MRELLQSVSNLSDESPTTTDIALWVVSGVMFATYHIVYYFGYKRNPKGFNLGVNLRSRKGKLKLIFKMISL